MFHADGQISTHGRAHALTHTHTHTHIYIYSKHLCVNKKVGCGVSCNYANIHNCYKAKYHKHYKTARH